MELVKKYEWVQALYSGEYDQCRERLKLFDSDGHASFCCLGVLCDISGEGEWKDHVYDVGDGYGEFTIDGGTHGSVTELPYQLMEKYKLSRDQTESLTRMNDKGFSFTEIGDWIRLNIGID